MSMPGRKFVSIGAGLIGRSWVIRFAAGGWRVTLFDADRQALQSVGPLIQQSLEMAARTGSPGDPTVIAGRIEIADSLTAALAGAAWVQESVIEDLTTKQRLWRDIDAACEGGAILGSSTSALAGSLFMRDLQNRERALVVHPALPPHVIPLVELVPTPWTDRAVTAEAASILRELGNYPVTLKKEINGFLWNRLQIALVKEGMNLVADGLCDVSDIDAVFVHGLGLRLAFTGIFESMHLAVQGGFRETPDKYAGFPLALPYDPYKDWPARGRLETTLERILEYAEKKVPVEDLDERRRWRERMVMELLKLKRREAECQPGD